MAKSNNEKSRVAQRKIQQDVRVVEIRRINAAQRKKRERLEADPPALLWELFNKKALLETEQIKPLSRPFTSDNLDMISDFVDHLKYGGDQITLAFRGGDKTTTLRNCITAALLAGWLKYGLYVAATASLANQTLDYIQAVIAASEGVRKLYPEVADPVRNLATGGVSRANSMLGVGRRFDNDEPYENAPLKFVWSKDDCIFPSTPGSPSNAAILATSGADKPIRGLNIRGHRPTAMFGDDLDTPNTTRTKDQCDKVLDRLTYDIGGLRGEGARMCRLIIGTLSKHGAGVAYELSGEGSGYAVKRYQFLHELPERMDLWKKYIEIRKRNRDEGDTHAREAHAFYLANRKAMDSGANASNEHKFDRTKLRDGTQAEVSAVQHFFNRWADNGQRFVDCELQNERIEPEINIVSNLNPMIVASCASDYARRQVHPETIAIRRGVDIRNTEIHHATIATDPECPHRIIDYNIKTFGYGGETTIKQSEELVLRTLRNLRDEWEQPYFDSKGGRYYCEATLIDVGWRGSWDEKGKKDSWKTQPVETFCQEAGSNIDRDRPCYCPAKGIPLYEVPKELKNRIVGDGWHWDRVTKLVSWDAENWQLLVEELFMLSEDKYDRFSLFVPSGGVWENHAALADHVMNGAELLKNEQRRRITGEKKDKRRLANHWWDALAMALVGKSVTEQFAIRKARRSKVKFSDVQKRKRRAP